MRRIPSVQTLAMLAAVAFLLVGVLGFVPGFTVHYGKLSFAGHGSGAELFGIFQVSVLHNLVHLAFGVVGAVLARTADGARRFLLVGGIVYLAIWMLGVSNGGGWIPVNYADDWLHFLLGIGLIGLGFAASRRAEPEPRPA
ncbi:MAG TPA: DUF4383 domain-containing protein [Gaiellaceae bacterium]|nr:DUF4383 domain-containing protein [Gaiellaceae bacterium]